MFLGDDFHHNGAFRLSYGFEYVAMMETDRSNARFAFDRYDTFEWYLKLGALSNVSSPGQAILTRESASRKAEPSWLSTTWKTPGRC
jgi:hypothetical protein